MDDLLYGSCYRNISRFQGVFQGAHQPRYCFPLRVINYMGCSQLVSDSVLFKDILPQIEKVLSIVHVDVGTCHLSVTVCVILVLLSYSVHAHILNIR